MNLSSINKLGIETPPFPMGGAFGKKRGKQGDVAKNIAKYNEHPSCRRHPDGEISPC